MADVFISYSQKNPELTRTLAAWLEERGLTTWWDGSLESKPFAQQIWEQIDAARVVIVIWTPDSIKSDFVYSEASRGKEQGKLVALKINETRIGDAWPPFNTYHTLNFYEFYKIEIELKRRRLSISSPKQVKKPGHSTAPGLNMTASSQPRVDIAYRLAKLDGSDEVLRDFANKYPNDERAKQIMADILYLRFIKDQSDAALLSFLEKFSNDLRANEMFECLSDKGMIQFVRQFPNHPRVDELLTRLESHNALFSKAKTDDNLEAYEYYCAVVPKGLHVVAAENIVKNLEKQFNAFKLGGYDPKNYSGDTSLSVAFSPDGRTLASGSWDDTVKLWEVGTGRLMQTLKGHALSVMSVAFSPDGRTLTSGSSDGTVKLWEAGTGQLTQTLSGHAGFVRSVAFSSDGRTLASGSADNTVKLWEAGTGRLTQTLDGHAGIVYSVAFSPDGRTLALGSLGGTIKLWEAGTGQLTQTLSGHAGFVMSIAFSPDGRTLASGSSDETIKLWEAGTGQLTQTLSGHADTVTSVVFSPDGRTLASGSKDGTIKLWEAGTGRLIRTLSGHASFIYSVAFSPDGRTLASGALQDGLRLWSTESGQGLAQIHALPEGEWVAIGERAYVASPNAQKYLYLAIDGAERPIDDDFKRRWRKKSLSLFTPRP